MADVLVVQARKLGDPVSFGVGVKPDNGSSHFGKTAPR
jgi:hypothetical protein